MATESPCKIPLRLSTMAAPSDRKDARGQRHIEQVYKHQIGHQRETDCCQQISAVMATMKITQQTAQKHDSGNQISHLFEHRVIKNGPAEHGDQDQRFMETFALG